MTPLQQLQEEDQNITRDFVDKYHLTEYNFDYDGDCEAIAYYWIKIINQEREKAFKLGQISGIELSEECIPEEIKYIDPSGEKIYYQDNLAEQFNKCRTESLTNISDLKQKIQHE